MQLFKKSFLVIFSFVALLGLQACEDESAFEEAGENMDNAVDETQDSLENAGDEIEEEFE